jgi:hypothetical protein
MAITEALPPIEESVDQIVSSILADVPDKRRPPGWSEADRFDYWLGLVMHAEDGGGDAG